jgi:hypothetical protein
MRARGIATLVAIALTLAGGPRVAWAAPPPSAADVASAKQLFAQGLKLYNEGSYREALADFQRANTLAPRVSIQRNIAQCHRDLKDFAAAYDAYQVLLATYGASMSAPDKRAVQRAIDELAMLTGSIQITVADAGAAVAIDGHDAGTTPVAKPVRVNLGPHTVTVTKTGFETLTKEVKLSGGDQATVDGPLQPEVTTGHLVVSAPAAVKVEVFVDGTDVGAAPWEGDVKPGVHLVEGKGAGQVAAPKQVDVARKARVEMVLDLTAQAGHVQVDTHTADATISIDDQVVGHGVWEGPLTAGQHQLSIEATGYRSYRRAFIVHAGENFVEDARLENETDVKYEGIYSGLALFGFATPSGNSTFLGSNASSPLGAGLAVRVGYAFGWIALEGMGFGSYDYSSGTITEGTAGSSTDIQRSDAYAFHRFGGGGAVGLRVANEDPHLRFTGSVLGGLAAMGNIYTQSASPTSTSLGTSGAQNTSSATTYTAPLLVFDGGVLVGWPNGAKFHISALCMAQFVGSPAMASPLGKTGTGTGTSYSTPALSVASGTQVFIGPLIGFDLGL